MTASDVTPQLTWLIVGGSCLITFFIAVIMVVASAPNDDKLARQQQEAIHRITQGAEREMELTSSRHHAALNELRRRTRHGETNQ